MLEIQTRAVVHGVRDFKLEFQAGMKASKISLAGSAALAANVPFTGLALLILAKSPWFKLQMGCRIGFEKQRMDSRKHMAWTFPEIRGGSDQVSLVTVLITRTGLFPESNVFVKMKGLSSQVCIHV